MQGVCAPILRALCPRSSRANRFFQWETCIRCTMDQTPSRHSEMMQQKKMRMTRSRYASGCVGLSTVSVQEEQRHQFLCAGPKRLTNSHLSRGCQRLAAGMTRLSLTPSTFEVCTARQTIRLVKSHARTNLPQICSCFIILLIYMAGSVSSHP